MMGDDPDKQNVTSVDVDVHEVFQRNIEFFKIGYKQWEPEKCVKCLFSSFASLNFSKDLVIS